MFKEHFRLGRDITIIVQKVAAGKASKTGQELLVKTAGLAQRGRW